MPIKADFHLHSHHSGDSQAPMEAMIHKALELGFDTMCFTEHNDFVLYGVAVPGTDPEAFKLDTETYSRELHRLQKEYADKIQILFGVELGLHHDVVKENNAVAEAHDYDFIIGSSHMCYNRDPYLPAFFENRTEEEAYGEYFQCTLDNIKSFSNFDVYGHLDYVVRYGPNQDRNYTYEKYQDILDPILKLLIEMGKGIELNTSGIYKGLSDFHPCTSILKRYRELGGEILTVGSDAHWPENLGSNFVRAAEHLKSCGFRYYTIFKERKPQFRPL